MMAAVCSTVSMSWALMIPVRTGRSSNVPLKGYIVRGPELALQKSIPRLEVQEDETLPPRRRKRPE